MKLFDPLFFFAAVFSLIYNCTINTQKTWMKRRQGTMQDRTLENKYFVYSLDIKHRLRNNWIRIVIKWKSPGKDYRLMTQERRFSQVSDGWWANVICLFTSSNRSCWIVKCINKSVSSEFWRKKIMKYKRKN